MNTEKVKKKKGNKTFSLTESLRNELESRSDYIGISQSSLVTMALNAYFRDLDNKGD